MKVDGSLKSLLQGVSQQPPRDRLPGQSTAQDNMSSDPITGLTRRHPTDLINRMLHTADPRGFQQFQTRDKKEHIAFFHDGTVHVLDLNGVMQPLTIDPASIPYLQAPGEFKVAAVDEDITVVNTGVVTRMRLDVTIYENAGPGTRPMGIVQILGGQYGCKYTIVINGIEVAAYITPSGAEASHSPNIQTDRIAKALADQTRTALGAGWSVLVSDDIILIVNEQRDYFTVNVTDGRGNANSKVMTENVKGIEDLPRRAPGNYLARVATESDPQMDTYFKFVLDGGGSSFGGPGYWQEAAAPNIQFRLDAATMPHRFVYDASTQSFTFGPYAWEDRKVGTDTSNPKPSFIDNPIQDAASFQGRMVLLSGSALLMSRTNKPNNFWVGSVTAQADTDPIDIRSNVDSSTLRAAVPYNKDLVAFSNTGQFIVFGRNAITPKNASLVLTTSFEAELNAKPQAAGKNIFFATNYGLFSGIREFFAEGASDINDSRQITQHVKKYLKGQTRQITASSNFETLVVHTDADLKEVYLYQYIWADNEKLQSSWSKWSFPFDVVFSAFVEDTIYFVMQRGTEFFLTRLTLDGQDTVGIGYNTYLDLRYDVLDVYQQFTIPYASIAIEDNIFIQAEGCPNPGLRAKAVSMEYSEDLQKYVVTLDTNMNGGRLVGGLPYRSSYMPTMPFIKDGDGVVIATAKLRVRNFIVSLFETGEIIGHKISDYKTHEPIRFNGRVTGANDNLLGAPVISDRKFMMPFRADTQEAEVEFYTDSHLPMTLLDIEWVAQYSKRGRRISTGGA